MASTMSQHRLPTFCQGRTLPVRGVGARPSRLLSRAVDPQYKRAGNKSTLEDQAREAEAKRNSSEFVQEFKEDLGVSGERQSKEDKQDVESRESDAIGIRRAKAEQKDAQEAAELDST